MTCFPHFDIRAKTRSRVTTATTFSCRNDAGSRAYATYYWENLVLIIVLVLESKGLLCPIILHLRCFTSLLIGFLSALQYRHASVGFFLDTCYETRPPTILHVSYPYSRTGTTSLSFVILRMFLGARSSLIWQIHSWLLTVCFSGLSYTSLLFQVFLFQVFPFQVFHTTSLLLSLLKLILR